MRHIFKVFFSSFFYSLSSGLVGISLSMSHLQSSVSIWPGLHCFHFPVLLSGHVDMMNTCRDVKPASLAFMQISSLMFFIQRHCAVVMTCYETFLPPNLQPLEPRGLILQYVNTLITASVLCTVIFFIYFFFK